MIEFNSDGSVKMPSKLAKHKAGEDNKMQNTHCMKVRKEIVSGVSPKSCALHITLSNKITDKRFVENIYNEFNQKSEVPSKLIKVSDKEFKVNIGTCFRRCSDCSSLISRYREFLNSNMIEHDGGCTFKQNRGSNFSYEDYF